MEYITLNNHLSMPALGLGTWTLRGQTCSQVVTAAIQIGYRLIDTARMYQNEEAVGIGIKKSGIPRSELFITTKICAPDTTYALTANAIDQSLLRLGLDEIDLVLIHEPYETAPDMYRALEDALQAGKLRSIGISNFNAAEYDTFLSDCSIIPAVNQIESHIYYRRDALREHLKTHTTHAQAWAPLTEGKRTPLSEPILKYIGLRYGKTPAQVNLRYLLDLGYSTVVKSVHTHRLKENLDIFDFHLTPEELQEIGHLNDNASLFGWYEN